MTCPITYGGRRKKIHKLGIQLHYITLHYKLFKVA